MHTFDNIRSLLIEYNKQNNFNLEEQHIDQILEIWNQEVETGKSVEEIDYASQDKDILEQVISIYFTTLEQDKQKISDYIVEKKTDSLTDTKKKPKSKKRNQTLSSLRKQYNLDFRTIADILEVAGLPEADSYTPEQVKIFDNAYKEFSNQKENLHAKTQQRIAKLLARQANEQGGQVADAIAGVSTSLREEVETQFVDMTYQKLAELYESGELDKMIEAKVVEINGQSPVKKKRFLPEHLFSEELMLEAQTQPVAVIEAATDEDEDNDEMEMEMEEEEV